MRMTFISLLVDMCLFLCCSIDRRNSQKEALPGGNKEPFFNVQFLRSDEEDEEDEEEKIAKVKVDSLHINNTPYPLRGESDFTTSIRPIPLLMNEDSATYEFFLKEESDAGELSHTGNLTVSYQREIFKDLSNTIVMHVKKLKLVDTNFKSVQFGCLGRDGKLEQVIGKVSNCNSNETTLKIFLHE